ncbi:fatty acyl-AMP ligase [Lichenicoccus roseus]|uniref:Fatty acyl-AMP ligase n=1 Tax=Lichenicoccus roseus TaxID=2683649 RepID=A0A5R9J6M3_9PROT|nr:fatty acyl-AMP ligase [Lichenicoccus roseus]TLU72619.1 fatty acyl-AMP ligase [Lichenicoccus roseus]
MTAPTPTRSGLDQLAGEFVTLADALDYAADGETGLNFYSIRGELTLAMPYRTLRHEALALARRLLQLGLRQGERVAIVAETHPDFMRVFFACQYAGLVPAPLPMPFVFGGRETYVAHVRRLIEEAQAVALFVPEALRGWFSPADAGSLRLCSTLAGLPADGEDLPCGGTGADIKLPTIGADHTAYLQFSSGSTRFPIGVVVQQRALMANISGILQHGLQIRPDDRAISWLPLYHDMGLVGFLLSPLAGQVSVDLLATQDFVRRPQLWLSLITGNRGTISYSPSFGYELCTRRERAINKTELDLSSWRIAGIGGDMIRPASLASFARIFAPCGYRPEAFLPSYGMAEATLAISFAPVGRGIETDIVDLDRLEQDGVAARPASLDTRARTLVLCGTSLPGHEIEIRSVDGDALGDRRVGRIFVRGASLMKGYDRRPDETQAILSPDGWLETGDLGYRLGDTLVLTGRAKDLIIINGRNIWPQDLEWSIERSVADVRTGDVAAFSIEQDGHETLIVAVEARGVADPADSERLVRAVGDAVRAGHGLDSLVVLMAPGSLPYTSSGKLSRSAVRQRYLADRLAAVAVPA